MPVAVPTITSSLLPTLKGTLFIHGRRNELSARARLLGRKLLMSLLLIGVRKNRVKNRIFFFKIFRGKKITLPAVKAYHINKVIKTRSDSQKYMENPEIGPTNMLN